MNRTVLGLIFAPLLVLQGCSGLRADPDRGLGVETQKNHAIVRVFFATDRERRLPSSSPVSFTENRGELQYGLADVSIPRNHRIGVLEEPSWLRLEFRANPEKHVMLLDTELLSNGDFVTRLSERAKSSNEKKAFIFVHGYNVTFEQASRRTAQIAYDLKFDGIPAFYSWPSKGTLKGYFADETNVAWSVMNLEKFLSNFAENSGAQRIYLIGHSMGTRALTQAFLSVAAKSPSLKGRFVEIILAAPDIDAETFKRSIAPAMVETGAKVTLYTSSDDLALSASRQIRGGLLRAGESVVLVKGLETIDASGMGSDFLNHSYAIEDRSIISDMFYILGKRLRASERAGLTFVDGSPTGYWKFK